MNEHATFALAPMRVMLRMAARAKRPMETRSATILSLSAASRLASATARCLNSYATERFLLRKRDGGKAGGGDSGNGMLG